MNKSLRWATPIWQLQFPKVGIVLTAYLSQVPVPTPLSLSQITTPTMAKDQFTGYAALQPLDFKSGNSKLESYTFEARPLDPDEVEILVSACGM